MEKNKARRQEYPLPRGFREPTDGSMRYFPWGAMPTNIYRDDVPHARLWLRPDVGESAIKRRQRGIQNELQKLYEIPPADIPAEFAELVATDTFIGEQRRSMKNYESYMTWKTKAQLPEDYHLKNAMYHMEDGTAYVGEILDVALGTELETFEVGKVTHPYRRRFQFVEPFRQEVDRAIVDRGGNILPRDVIPYRNVDVVPYFTREGMAITGLSGLITRYKRDVGVINRENDRARIVERQLAGLRVDAASGFDQEIAHNMLEALPTDDEKRELADIAKHDGAQHAVVMHEIGHRILVKSGCMAYVEDKIQNNSLEPFVVPLSTTIYGYKEPIESNSIGQNFVTESGRETDMLLVKSKFPKKN